MLNHLEQYSPEQMSPLQIEQETTANISLLRGDIARQHHLQ